MLFGHLAVSALLHRYTKAEFVPVMAATVLPDAVDKVAHYALGQTDHGRAWGHTLLGLALSSLVVTVLWGRRAGRSWALGYLAHLLCDINSVVPWLYPFKSYEYPPSHPFQYTLLQGLLNGPRMLLELGLSLWAFLALRPQWLELKGRWLHPAQEC